MLNVAPHKAVAAVEQTLHEKPYMQRKMKSLAALVLYCITFSIMLVFFYPIFTERQEIDPVSDRNNKASVVLDLMGRQAPARSRWVNTA